MTEPGGGRHVVAPPVMAVGVDLVEIDRVRRVLRRHPRRFLTRHFTPAEQAQCGSDPHRLAMRWAAKEAAAKALGTGIGPIAWTEIEVLGDAHGAPRLALYGNAGRVAAALGLMTWAVSLSDTEAHAVAVVAAVGPGVADA